MAALAGTATAQVWPGVFDDVQSKPGPGAYVFEGIGATGTGAVFALLPLVLTGMGAYSIGMTGGSATPLIVGGCISAATYSVGCGAGAGWVGRAMNWDGSPELSYGLALVPAAVAIAGFIIAGETHQTAARDGGILFLAAGAPVRAAIGHNVRAQPLTYAGELGRLETPRLAAGHSVSRVGHDGLS